MAFTIAATQAAATDGRWPGRGAPSVLGETSAPITVPSGRTRGVIANQGAVVVARKSGEKRSVCSDFRVCVPECPPLGRPSY